MKKLGVILLVCVCMVGFVGLGKAFAADQSVTTLGGEVALTTDTSASDVVFILVDDLCGDPFWDENHPM